MTFTEKMSELLLEHGVWPHDAAKILADYVASPQGEPMAARMDDETDGYPSNMGSIVWLGVKGEALRWIDANAPKAWYRSMFVEAPAEKPQEGA